MERTFRLEMNVGTRWGNQGCQIALGTTDQKRVKLYQIATKYTKWP
jgi:hypothetical protein